jgi:hypothetical protein
MLRLPFTLLYSGAALARGRRAVVGAGSVRRWCCGAAGRRSSRSGTTPFVPLDEATLPARVALPVRGLTAVATVHGSASTVGARVGCQPARPPHLPRLRPQDEVTTGAGRKARGVLRLPRERPLRRRVRDLPDDPGHDDEPGWGGSIRRGRPGGGLATGSAAAAADDRGTARARRHGSHSPLGPSWREPYDPAWRPWPGEGGDKGCGRV